MNKPTKRIIGYFAALVFSVSITAQLPWEVPFQYKNLRNPYEKQADAAGIGKKLYVAHCMSCHGNMGNGNGIKATTLQTQVKNLALPEAQNQTDGELYYKSFIGRNEMPNFERRIPDEQERWFIINYLRTLKN